MEKNGFPNDEQHDEFDLAQYDDDFAGAPVEEKEFEEPPDGKYQVLVDKVEMARSKQTNAPMLKWQLKIVGPRCAGRYLFRNNMIASPENVKWLKNDLATCGMDVQSLKLSDLPNRLGELLDVTLEVQKKTNGEYANVYLNKRIHIDLPSSHAASGGEDASGEFLPF